MQRWASVIVLVGVGMGVASAADPLPAPKPVPDESLIPAYGRTSTADTTAEIHNTRDGNTYIYVVNGFDPLHLAHLDRFAERLRVSGFPNTKFGEYYDMPAFEAEYRKIRVDNLQARVVLIGYGPGCSAVIAAAHRLICDGFPVAMLAYIGGDYLTDHEHNRPSQVTKVINIRGNGFLLTGQNLLWNGSHIRGAQNLRLLVPHYCLPLRPETFKLVYEGLTSLPAPSLPASP